MADPIATVADVRGEIETDLDDGDITPYLDDAAFENDRVNDAAGMDDELRRQIEKKYAALKILTRRDRATTRESLGSASKTYEIGTVDDLERELTNLDPSGDLLDRRADQWVVTTTDVTD